MNNKSKKIQTLLICVICVIFALLLSLTVTMAYFGRNRNFAGTIEFSPGIKIEYLNVESNANNSFSLLKLGNSKTFINFDGTLTPLNESSSDVSSADIFYIANPELKPALTTIDYYIRVKIEFKTSYEDGAVVQDRVMTSAEIENVFGISYPLNINASTDNSIGFVYKDGYYYLVNAGITEVSGYEDLYKNNQTNRASVYIFESAGVNQNVNYFKLPLAEIVDEYLVDNFKLSITVEAIDARENSGAITSNVWNI